MSQNDLVIANQSFPSFRTDLNSALQAINTSQSGTSRPSGAVSGTIWLDTTSATTPTLKYYDGADDISLATLDHSANTVNWLDSTVSITGLSTTATGTVLTLSDSASTSTVNLIIDNQKEIRFRETTANGTNYIGLKAPASVTADLTFTLPVAPTVNNQALISTTAGVMAFTPYTFPTSDGTASQVLQTNGSGVLSFATPSGGANTPLVQANLTGGDQSISATTYTKIAFNTETIDTGSIYNNGTYTATIATTGKYFVSTYCRLSALNGTSDLGVLQIANSARSTTYATTVASGNTGYGFVSLACSALISLSASDTLSVFVYGTEAVSVSEANAGFTIFKVIE